MTIAVDAMGGDHAPKEVVLGCIQAAEGMRAEIVLVGDPARIEPHLPRPAPRRIQIHPAYQVVEMGDKPIDALRRKKDSSLAVAAALVKDGVAGAMISAGNTGATAAAALLSWRQAKGVDRPAIASFMPNAHGGFLLLDAGASPDVDSGNFVEFAIMGRAYAESVMGRRNAKVHLLNIGEEPGKGNAMVKRAYELLSGYPWFAGNIEGKDMYRQPCDVIVCDAFVGNVVLKTSEGVAEYITSTMREHITSSRLAQAGYLLMQNVLKPFRKQLDYAEYGGSPLLGLNGLCIVCHGRSNAKAIKNAVLQAQRCLEAGLIDRIEQSFAEGARA